MNAAMDLAIPQLWGNAAVFGPRSWLLCPYPLTARSIRLSFIAQFADEADVERALSELRTYWNNLLSKYILQSHDDKLNRMVNIWNPYQCMVTFNMSRSASYFESGIGRGVGFRDSNQDLLGFVHQIPERARERIIDIASTQFENGGAYHQYQPLTKKGNHEVGGGFKDDPLWLIEGRIAESVFIAGLFVYTGADFIELCKRRGLGEEAATAQAYVDRMQTATLEHGFDGEWFLRAYDHYGDKIGSKDCEEGQIFIEPQGFCVMAGIGVEEGLAQKALDSTRNRLETPYGIMLQNPPYSRYYINLGEISSYPPGYKENAGIFCHNNPWIMMAEAVIGRGDRAFELYSKIAPTYLEDISDIHRTEPYVYAQMIAGKDAVREGEAKNSWLTGTAAWNFIAITQSILGIQPEWDGLRIDPCIPTAWDEFTVTRVFRGDTYVIHITNPQHVSKGVATVTVDGTVLTNNILPVAGGGAIHQVKVLMG